MRFKEFLLQEDGVAVRHLSGAKMTLDQMIEWVQNNAFSFVGGEGAGTIFRGVASRDAEGLFNGTQMNRTAANTKNYANLWMSNHSDWSQYPARNKSFICTTDVDYAEGYGYQYIVIPSDGSTIGICPDGDLWESFPEVKEAINDYGIDEFMNLIHEVIVIAGKHASTAEKDWDQLAYVLNDLDTDNVKQVIKTGTENTDELAGYLLSYMEKNQLETLYQVFEKVFDPKVNRFATMKAANFEADQNREVWMSGSILMVKPETWRQLKDKL